MHLMKHTILGLGMGLMLSGTVLAQNPIIQTSYTADPAPLVYNDKVYLYTSHDEPGSTWFTMNDWRLYTTSDMVNWTDHGAVLSYKDFSWGKINAWAPQCVERDGKFYMYVPVTDRNNQNGIGVAVSDSPYGPFIDPLGKPLIRNSSADIDPTVFVDDDGQAYIMWGNPVCYFAKLHEDMISIDGEVGQFPNTIESFGKRKAEDPRRPTTYEEGPWLYKRNSWYYLLFAAGELPEHLGYSMSKSPVGPWDYKGVLMPAEGRSFTNHPGIIDYKGKTYLFYHNGALPGGSGFTRSVAVEEVKFNSDGTIVPMKMTSGISKGLENLNPYVKNEAETIAWSEGVKARKNAVVGNFVVATSNESYIKVAGVDFRDHGPSKFFARVSTVHNGGVTLEARLGGKDGQLVAELKVPLTGGDDRWEIVQADVQGVKGIHDLYFVFKGKAPSDILYFDYWRFTK
jgi:arabinoxylan arabinofuranohydrolase